MTIRMVTLEYGANFENLLAIGGSMRIWRKVEHHKERQQNRVLLLLPLADTSTSQFPFLYRALLLITAIVLVIFALYMVRPSPRQAPAGLHHLSSAPAAVTSTAPPREGSLPGAVPPAQTKQPPSNNQTTVVVNGQSIPVPKDGTLHKTITDGASTTTINLSASGGDSSSSTNISVQSSSSSSSSTDGT